MPQLSLDLTDTRHQLVGVELSFMPRRALVELQLPAWTPGSYLIRDYVSRLEGFSSRQGETACAARRLGVARWQLAVTPDQPLQVSYRILARECTVRTAHLSPDHAFLPLAAVVLEVEGERWSAWRLQLRLPDHWQGFVPLDVDPDESSCWLAANYDALVDAPLEAGPHVCHSFKVAGVSHRWVGWGEDLPSRDPSWLADVASVCDACCRLLGESGPPAPHYLFILHLLERGYGGLEHDQASVLQFGRHALVSAKGRRELLQLVAHEYLHQWNVRRLRPAELTPVAYGQPTIVPTLWFAEGVTSYYDQLLPLVAGCCDQAAYLEDLEQDLSRYLGTPGRHVQSLRLSSEEAWVKLYRQDAAAPDSQVSYYLKGAVLALVLDLHLRCRGSSLAAVLQQLWRRFGRQGRGYREQNLMEAFAHHDPDLAQLLPAWLESREDPPLLERLEAVGLTLQPDLDSRPATGIVLEDAGGSALIRRVRRQSAGSAAGLIAGDELLAVDGDRVRSSESLAALWREGQAQEVLFCRDGRIRHTLLTPGSPQPVGWRLRAHPDPTPAQLKLRRRWLEVVA